MAMNAVENFSNLEKIERIKFDNAMRQDRDCTTADNKLAECTFGEGGTCSSDGEDGLDRWEDPKRMWKRSESNWKRPESVWIEYVFEWNPLMAEIEALDACRWLKDAGFPQYAQMYKDRHFPIDMETAGRDHEFLDCDSLQAVFRRLDMLNKCATVSTKLTPPTASPRKSIEDSDDDDLTCTALSTNWTYQSSNKQWSRTALTPTNLDLVFSAATEQNSGLASTGSPDSALADGEEQPTDTKINFLHARENMTSSADNLHDSFRIPSSVDRSTLNQTPVLSTTPGIETEKRACPWVRHDTNTTREEPQCEMGSKVTGSDFMDVAVADCAGSSAASNAIRSNSGDGVLSSRRAAGGVNNCHNKGSVSGANEAEEGNIVGAERAGRLRGDGCAGGEVGGVGRSFGRSLVESLTGRKTPTMKKKPLPLTRHDISEPTVVDSARLRAKLERLGCVDLAPPTPDSNDVFTSSSSPSPCSPFSIGPPSRCTPPVTEALSLPSPSFIMPLSATTPAASGVNFPNSARSYRSSSPPACDVSYLDFKHRLTPPLLPISVSQAPVALNAVCVSTSTIIDSHSVPLCSIALSTSVTTSCRSTPSPKSLLVSTITKISPVTFSRSVNLPSSLGSSKQPLVATRSSSGYVTPTTSTSYAPVHADRLHVAASRVLSLDSSRSSAEREVTDPVCVSKNIPDGGDISAASSGYNNVFRSSKRYAERRVFVSSSSHNTKSAAGDRGRENEKSANLCSEQPARDVIGAESVSSGSGNRSQFEEELSWGNSEEDAELQDYVSGSGVNENKFVRSNLSSSATADVTKPRIGSVYDNVTANISSTLGWNLHQAGTTVGEKDNALSTRLSKLTATSYGKQPLKRLASAVVNPTESDRFHRTPASDESTRVISTTSGDKLSTDQISEFDLILSNLYLGIQTLGVRGKSSASGVLDSVTLTPQTTRPAQDVVEKLFVSRDRSQSDSVQIMASDTAKFSHGVRTQKLSEDQALSPSLSPTSPSSGSTPVSSSSQWCDIGEGSGEPALVALLPSTPSLERKIGGTVEAAVNTGRQRSDNNWSYTNDNDRESDDGDEELCNRENRTKVLRHEENEEEAPDRRDSGVGSSLTRQCGKRNVRPRLRWHSFAKSHQTSICGREEQLNSLSAGQLVVLRKLSLLKVTAALEKYSNFNLSNKHWFVPRLLKRVKSCDYVDRRVFAVPLSVTQRRHGQPLPQCILYAMRRLRRTAHDSVGIFRKSGVRSRIQALRDNIESDPDSVKFESLHTYDVADLLKLYFRELPECLLTNKLSNVFMAIFIYVPEEFRKDLLAATILLLPDEHRETLQSLLLFLSDMAAHAKQNQMSASNLAICFAPAVFHLCGGSGEGGSSGKRIRKHSSSPSGGKHYGKGGGMPTEKDLREQIAAQQCLACLIDNAKTIFTASEEMLSKCHLSYLEQGDPVSLTELCSKHDGNYSAYIDSCIQGVLKESRDKFKGWVSVPTDDPDVDLRYKKVGDGHPLRLWKWCVEVEAPPAEVLHRVLHERQLWDADFIRWRVVSALDSRTEVFQYELSAMAPHPTRDFCELRSWRDDLPRGVCVLVSTSVEHPDAPLISGGIRSVVLASRYLIEPCGSGRSRLTHISRIDIRGHTLEWYNSIYGHICASYALGIRDSLRNSRAIIDGPETSV